MKLYNIINRIIQISITLLGISLISYALIYLAPGDPIRTMFISSGAMPNEEIIDQTRELMGLNDSFIQQYISWIGNVVKGDLGMSYSLSQPVSTVIFPRVISSLYLAVSSLLLMLLVSIPLGILSAVYKDKLFDYLVRGYTFVAVSSPNFLIGTLLLYFLALKFTLFPVVSIDSSIRNLVLPSVTLAIAMSGKYIRQIRTIVLDELSQEYILGAKSRGYHLWELVIKEMLPNILPPMVTLIGLSFGSLLSGVAVVEVIFSYPGIGNLAVNAITSYDYNLIQAYVLLISTIYMSVNFVVDISYRYLDPRMKKEN